MHSQAVDLQADVPFSAVNPSDRHIFQDDHNSERQTSRIIIKHGDKVIPWALNEQQATQEGHDAATHWNKRREEEKLGNSEEKMKKERDFGLIDEKMESKMVLLPMSCFASTTLRAIIQSLMQPIPKCALILFKCWVRSWSYLKHVVSWLGGGLPVKSSFWTL